MTSRTRMTECARPAWSSSANRGRSPTDGLSCSSMSRATDGTSWGRPEPRPDRRLLRARVDLNLDAVGADDPAVGELQLQPVDAVGEQALPTAEDRREDHQAELIDQIGGEQSS